MSLAEAKRIIDLLVATERPSPKDVMAAAEKQSGPRTEEERFGRVLEALDEAHRRTTTDAALCREIARAVAALQSAGEATAASFDAARRDAVVLRCGQIDREFGTVITQKLHEQQVLHEEVVAGGR